MLTLRAPEPEDLDFLFRLENDRTLWPVSSTQMPYSRYALKQYIASCPTDFHADRQVRLMADDGQGPVAVADLFNYQPLDGRAEIGLAVDGSRRGEGIGRETLQLLCDYARHTLGLRLLTAYIQKENEPCCQLFRSFPFQEVATLPEWLFFEGRSHDLVLFQKKI